MRQLMNEVKDDVDFGFSRPGVHGDLGAVHAPLGLILGAWVILLPRDLDSESVGVLYTAIYLFVANMDHTSLYDKSPPESSGLIYDFSLESRS